MDMEDVDVDIDGWISEKSPETRPSELRHVLLRDLLS